MKYPFYKLKEINFHIALVCMNASTESEELNGVQTPLFLQALVIVKPRGSTMLSTVWKETVSSPVMAMSIIVGHSHTHFNPFRVALTS